MRAFGYLLITDSAAGDIVQQQLLLTNRCKSPAEPEYFVCILINFPQIETSTTVFIMMLVV